MRIAGLTLFHLLFSAIVPLVLAAQQPYGLPVSRVDVEGAPDSVLEGVSILPGDILTREAVRQAIQAIFDEGAYGQIEVDARINADQTTRLTFLIQEPYFLAAVALNPETLLERPLSNYVDLPFGERISRNQVDGILEVVREQLRRIGFFHAQVSPAYEFDEQSRLVTVTVRAEPGPAARTGSIRFNGGEQTFTDEELSRALGVGEGTRFVAERFEAGLNDIRSEFAELGFLNTAVSYVEIFDEIRNEVDVSIDIQLGPFTLVQVRGYDIDETRVRELVPVFEEGSVDPDLIEEGRVGLLEYLRQEGYFEAAVAAELFSAPRDNAFQINYVVTAGERFSAQEIQFDGNSFFESDTLRNAIDLTRDGLSRRGVFSPELLDVAADRVLRLYAAAGFSGTRVAPEYPIERNIISPMLHISEGRRLQIGNVSFTGSSARGDAELARIANLAPGQIYTPAGVENARSNIASDYHRQGYPDVRVEVALQERADPSTVDVTYAIREGVPYSIGRIFVAGNTRTRETVIRRNSELVEGNAYDPEEILQAEQRLYATGLFNRVEIVPIEKVETPSRDLLIQLEDASPLLLTYGIGVQDREGARGTVELTHSNLWGLDRSLSFRLRGSRRDQRFQTTYREPRLFNWDLDGFASLYFERTRQQFFDANRVDFSIQTLKQFSNLDNLLFSASFQTVNLRDIRLNPRANSFPDERGTFQIASLSTSFVRDSRNDPINPTRGNYFSGNVQVADRHFGSEVNFISLFTQAAIYRPANTSVLAGSFRFGWNLPYGSTVALPITERYFAGGSTTLRAFGLDEAGPEGGGNALAVVNAEYRFPIPFLISSLGGAAFYDTGTTFRYLSDFSFGDFTHTAGIGLRYGTPLGPIRFDIGFNLNRQPDEPSHQFVVTLGHTF